MNIRRRFRQSGITLVELMVSIALGMILIGAALSVMLGNRQTYRVQENLSRTQEMTRNAFELIARDIRRAGSTGCSTQRLRDESVVPAQYFYRVANVLNGAQGAAPLWSSTFGSGLRGYEGNQVAPFAAFGTATATRVGDPNAPANAVIPDALILTGPSDAGLIVTNHNSSTATFTVNVANHGINTGDLLLVCDYRQASIFQASAAQPTGSALILHAAGGAAPGNCSQNLGYADPAAGCGNAAYTYPAGATIYRFFTDAWYIGNGRDGPGLFLRQNAAAPIEIASGVTDMQVTYLAENGVQYVDATAITDWGAVLAMRVTLTVNGHMDGSNAATETVSRTFNLTTNLRSRTT